MSDPQERMTRCFLNVFPNVRLDEVPLASTSSLAAWDSVAHVTLLSAIAEEFAIEFDASDFEDLVSFPLLLDYIENRMPRG
jgi:acyl carrier protein